MTKRCRNRSVCDSSSVPKQQPLWKAKKKSRSAAELSNNYIMLHLSYSSYIYCIEKISTWFFADMVVWRIAVKDSYQIMNKWVGDMRICCFVVKIPTTTTTTTTTTTKLKTSSQKLYTWKMFHHRGASECLQDSTHAFLVEVEEVTFRGLSGLSREVTCKHTYNNCIRQSTYIYIYV